MKKVKHNKIEVCSKFKGLKDSVAWYNINKKEEFIEVRKPPYKSERRYHVQ